LLNIKKMSVKDKVLFAISPTTFLLSKGVDTAVEKIQELTQNGTTTQELKEIAARQEIMAQMQASQAKVAQELAIAQRINTANVVEIEEYFDASGKGGLNVNLSESEVTGGISGEGRKVVKRIYRFTGWHEGASQVLEQQYEQDNEDQ
jgi:hypothetical protein